MQTSIECGQSKWFDSLSVSIPKLTLDPPTNRSFGEGISEIVAIFSGSAPSKSPSTSDGLGRRLEPKTINPRQPENKPIRAKKRFIGTVSELNIDEFEWVTKQIKTSSWYINQRHGASQHQPRHRNGDSHSHRNGDSHSHRNGERQPSDESPWIVRGTIGWGFSGRRILERPLLTIFRGEIGVTTRDG